MNKVVKIVIWILAILIIFIESFLLIKSVVKSNDTTDENNSLEHQLENVSNENKQITTDYLLTVIEDDKLNIFDQFQTNIDFKEDEIQKKLTYAYWYLKDDYDFSKGVFKEIIENLFLKTFGDEQVNHQSVICECGEKLLTYSQDKYTFSKDHDGHGGCDFPYGADYNKPLSLTISNNQYKLVVSKLFIDGNKAYSNIDLYGNHLLFEYENKNNTNDDIIKQYENNYEEYKDKVTKYSYTFEKKKGKFILIKYKILG